MLVQFPGSFPVLRVDLQHGSYPRCQVDEAPMIADFPVTKQPGEQGQRVLREGLVDKWFLPFQGSRGATAWLVVIVEAGIDYLWEQLGHRSQTGS